MEEPPDSAGHCLSNEGSKEELVQVGRQGRESQARGGCGREGLKARSDRDQWRRQGSREGSLGAFEAETQQVRRP